MKLLSPIGNLIDRLCVVAGAFIGSQIPLFMQQYTQRLAGHVEELNRLLNQMRQVAFHSNKTLEQYIQKFISSSDPDFVHQGEFMQGILLRWEEFNHAFYQLSKSSLWDRPYVFLKEIQYDIAASTLASFQPGISLNLEGFCYAGIGIVLGWAFYHMISKCILFGCSRVKAILK